MKCTKMAVVAALVLLSVPCIAQSQQHFPAKPIRMIIGYTPGSEIDVIGRMVAYEMSEHWGQKVVVDNRPGAGSTVAAAIAAVASPDGYTLFFNSVSHAATPGLYSKLPFDTLRDFAGVSQVTSAPNVLVVAPAQGIKSLKELIVFVKQRPGQINYGSAGIGSGTHITGEMLILAEQFKVSHIPYKGVPEVLTDTMTGRVQYSFAPIGNTLAFVKDKRLLPLAVTTLARSPMLPEVPTVAEAAIAGFEWDQWYGLFAPAKTPRPIVDRLTAEIAKIVATPAFQQKAAEQGAAADYMAPEVFGKFVDAESKRWAEIVKTSKIEAD